MATHLRALVRWSAVTDTGTVATHPLPAYMHGDPNPLADTPIQDDDEDVLPFGRMRWRNFERLNLAIATRVDGLRDAVEYGLPGEKQDGIDFVGRKGGTNAAYQVRRRKANLTARAVRKAVEEFVKYRPLSARRFVLCTAKPARATAVVRELDVLRQEHPDLDLAIWGAEWLTAILCEHPDLVVRFFNAAYRERFCGIAGERALPRPVGAGTPSIVEAVLRGPVKALGLQNDLRAAEGSSDPHVQATSYRALADALRLSPYRSLARSMRQREASALIETGEVDEACSVWLALAVDQIDAGLAPPGPVSLFRVRDRLSDAKPQIAARYRAVQARLLWLTNPIAGLDALESGYRELAEAQDPWFPRAALWWAEAALVEEHFSDVEQGRERLLEAIAAADDEALTVRLRLVLAEVSGDWTLLVREARVGLLAAEDAGLVHSRLGRILAWNGDPSGSIDSYRQALEPLMRAGLEGDSRAVLESIWRAQVSYGPLEDADTTALLLPTFTEGRTRLGDRYDPRESALEYLHSENWSSAHAEVKRLIWEARISGHFDRELRARQLLGDVYARTGDHAAAVGNYIRSGNNKEAAREGTFLASPLNVLPELHTGAPWVVATALSVVHVDGDRRSMEDAALIARRALELGRGMPQSLLGPQVNTQALAALAGLVIQIPDDVALAVLESLATLIVREPDTSRRTDESMLQLLAGFYDYHPSLKARARDALLLATSQSVVGGDVIDVLAARVASDTELEVELQHRSDRGELSASLALVYAGVSVPSVVSYVESMVDAFLERDEPETTNVLRIDTSVGNVGVLARLADPTRQAMVADALIRRATNARDIELHRAAALRGLYNLSDQLGDTQRDGLLLRCLQLADPASALSDLDAFFRQTQHPLSATRILLGAGELHRWALLGAARMARIADQMTLVVPFLESLLLSGDDADLIVAAQLLQLLHAGGVDPLAVQSMAGHSSAHVRAAAASIVSSMEHPEHELCMKLAGDSDSVVRLRMALGLARVAAHDDALANSIRQSLSGDPSARVRYYAGRERGDER